MANKTDVIRRWYQEIWINGHWDRIDEIYQPAPDNECLIPGATPAPEEAREIVTALTNLVTNHKLSVLHTVEQGDWVSALVELNGLKAATAQPVMVRWLTMSRVTDDLIVESYPQVNLIPFFEQLGQLPPHSFELMLAGQKLE
ncbi:MAG: ester cyclase [Roseobacter sp.]|jgi:hypothetical protein|nr:ester cyclase [Roseobacter sp.]